MPEAQAFIAHLLARNFLEDVSRDKGKFRSFLLASLNNFLANEHERASTQKRGGGVAFVPVDAGDAEEWLRAEPASTETPEDSFDRRWALTLLEQSFQRVREEFETADTLPKSFFTCSRSRSDNYLNVASPLTHLPMMRKRQIGLLLSGLASPATLLFTTLVLLTATLSAQSPANGTLRLHPDNPHYFLWRGKATVLEFTHACGAHELPSPDFKEEIALRVRAN